MSNHATKQQIRDVLSGKIQIRNGEPIQSIARYLRSSQKANRISESEQQVKKQVTYLSLSMSGKNLFIICGCNGAGKTTLLRTLSGLKDASSGNAEWNGREMLGKKPDVLVRRGISHVSEGKSVIPELTVKENLVLGGIWRANRSDTNAAIAEVVNAPT